MALRTIRTIGDEILRRKSKPVTDVTSRICELLDDMRDIIADAQGLGLAAPQVGVLKRICIVNDYDQKTEKSKYIEMINPEILSVSGSQTKEEGCLSFPGKSGIVERPLNVTVKYYDRKGKPHTFGAKDLIAVAVCHEVDHLDGILYVDKVIEMCPDGE